MSTDPSSLPPLGNLPPFHPQPQEPPAAPAPLAVPDQAMVASVLEQLQLKFAVDDGGDLIALWEGFKVSFTFRGDQERIFAVRSFYDWAYPAHSRGEVLALVDEWNHDTLWPKVYTYPGQDGTVRLVGESQMLIVPGIPPGHFADTLASWTQAAVTFAEWITNHPESPETESTPRSTTEQT